MITGLNHITLAVSDLERSVAFYQAALGCRVAAKWKEGSYLAVGNLWLALLVDADTRAGPLPEYTHIAFNVAQHDFAAAVERVRQAGAAVFKQNRSEGDSLYFLDPDGHKLEVHVGDLASRLAAMKARPKPGQQVCCV